MAANETTDMGGNAPAAGTRRRAVTAFFEDRAAAQAAIDDLVAEGIARPRVTLVEGGPKPVAHEAVPSDHKGFWQSLKDLFMADEDRHAYGEGLRRGGFLVSVETGDADHDRVVDLLDRDGAVDIDARAADWTLEGWDPARAAADLRPSAAVGPAFGEVQAHVASATPHLTDPVPGIVPTSPVDPVMVEPSAAVGPAFGESEAHPASATPHVTAPVPGVTPTGPIDPALVEPSPVVWAAFGGGQPHSASPVPRAADVAAARIDPQAIEPSAAVGPAFGSATPRPAAPGPTAIRDPGAASSRLRTYIEEHVRHDPQDASG